MNPNTAARGSTQDHTAGKFWNQDSDSPRSFFSNFSTQGKDKVKELIGGSGHLGGSVL